MKKNYIKYIIFLIPLIFISIFFFIIYNEYKSFLITNQNISFSTFLTSNIQKIVNLDINSDRIINKNINKNIYIYDKKFSDEGFLLVSGYNDQSKTSLTTLYSIKEERVLHTWKPPIEDIHYHSSDFTNEYNLKKNYRMQHPLLLENGDLIFSSGEGPLVKIDKCSNHIWSINKHFHHSIELYDKNLIIAPLVIKNKSKKQFPILDHGFALVEHNNGNIIKEFSILKILEDNKKIGLLYGVGEFEYDRVHLNDAENIKETDEYFNKGDIMLSSKHLSTVFLYRPSNNKIIWLKTGPWLNQHDVDYLGNGKFSIFGNDTFRYNQVENYDIFFDINNKIYIYDSKLDKIETIYDEGMINIKTPTQGLHEILKNGDIFIENTDNFELIRLSENNIRWKYYNYLGNERIGSIHWSRYLDKNTNFDWIESFNCN